MGLKKPLFFLYALLIIAMTWPIFAAWIPAFEKFWRWYPIGVLIGVFYISGYFKTRQFFWLAAYAMIVLINCMSGDKYMYDPIETMLYLSGLFFVGSAPFLFLKNENLFFSKEYFLITLVLLVYTSIVSFIFNLEFPDVVRNDMTSTGRVDFYEFSYLYRFGLTKYQFAHATPILIPPFVMGAKNKNYSGLIRVLLVSIVVLCILHAFASGSTTAFLVAITATAFTLVIKNTPIKENAIRFCLIGILFLPFFSVTVTHDVLGLIDSAIGSEGAIHEHIVDMQYSITKGSSGDVAERKDMYSISWDEFFSNPLWGTDNPVGQHSILLDHLAAFGLLGFIPFILFLWFQSESILRRLISSEKLYYWVSVLCALFLLATKQVETWIICVFLFISVPIALLCLRKERNSSLY